MLRKMSLDARKMLANMGQFCFMEVVSGVSLFVWHPEIRSHGELQKEKGYVNPAGMIT